MHGYFQSRRPKNVTFAPHRLSNFKYNKIDDFSIVALFRVLILAAMCT